MEKTINVGDKVKFHVNRQIRETLTGIVRRPTINKNDPWDEFWIIDGEDGVVHWVKKVEKIEETEVSKQEELLPCPRCGAKASVINQYRQDPKTSVPCNIIDYGVQCDECPLMIPMNYGREQACEIWNERIKRYTPEAIKS